MGNENVIKDPNIQIYLQLKQLVYYSGQKVKGCVYVEVKEYSRYSELMLRLQGFEKTENKDVKDKNQENLIDERRTYFQELRIAEFMNGFYQGQHQFPFNLILPSNFPGSLVLSPNTYIRYRITAYLQSLDPLITNQLHSREIWLLQPFHSTVQPIFCREIQQPKCCMFAYSYGNVQTSIQCEKNCVQPGEKVKLKFQVNTFRLNSGVKNAKIRVVEKNVIVTGQHYVEKQVQELFAFDFNEDVIEKGQIKKMDKSITFPLDLYPTAIGQLLSRFYIIQILLSFSCYSHLKQQLPIFISSSKSTLPQQNKPFPRPKKWKPTKYKKLQFSTLKPYEYKPHEKMSFLNPFNEENKNVTSYNKLDDMKITEPGSNRRIDV